MEWILSGRTFFFVCCCGGFYPCFALHRIIARATTIKYSPYTHFMTECIFNMLFEKWTMATTTTIKKQQQQQQHFTQQIFTHSRECVVFLFETFGLFFFCFSSVHFDVVATQYKCTLCIVQPSAVSVAVAVVVFVVVIVIYYTVFQFSLLIVCIDNSCFLSFSSYFLDISRVCTPTTTATTTATNARETNLVDIYSRYFRLPLA